MKATKLKLGVAQYLIEDIENWSASQNKIIQWVEHAKAERAGLLLMPEYAGLELMGCFSGNELEQMYSLQDLLPNYLEFFQIIAKKYHIYLQPGTLPVHHVDNQFYNRAFLFSPYGSYGYQDKIQLTRFEKESGLIISGEESTIFSTEFGKIAIAICYDSEFPLQVHRLVAAGAQLVLVPSCTDRVAGYYRVHLSCRARALENQCFIAQSPVIGYSKAIGFIDENVGAAGIYSPVDIGFPDDGILAQGEMNKKQLIVAELDFLKLEKVRKQGQVANFYDIQQSLAQPLLPIQHHKC